MVESQILVSSEESKISAPEKLMTTTVTNIKEACKGGTNLLPPLNSTCTKPE